MDEVKGIMQFTTIELINKPLSSLKTTESPCFRMEIDLSGLNIYFCSKNQKIRARADDFCLRSALLIAQRELLGFLAFLTFKLRLEMFHVYPTLKNYL